MLEIRTLGGLSLKLNGQDIKDIGSHKAEALLVYVVMRGGVCNRNTLATLLWPESSDSQAMSSLRVALSALRRSLEDHLDVSRDRVGIKTGMKVFIDVAELERMLTSGEIEQALDIYQGDFLQGFFIRDCLEFEDWRRLQQERVSKLVNGALHTAILNAVESENYARGLSLARRLLEIDALDEEAHRKCILLFTLNGQKAHALEQYEKCRAILQAELGIEPSAETQKLYDRIIKGKKQGYELSPISVINLPIPQTSFIGREQELAQIARLLSNPDCRLLTLLGPGGIGKTRLALKVVARCFHNFSDGCSFVSLEGISSSDYLVHTIADAVQFRIDDFETLLDAKHQLTAYLKNRSILLVMDGFENMVASGGLLTDILGNTSHVKILVTTRQKLDLQGEWIFPVTGLPVEQVAGDGLLKSSPAEYLFIERARQANLEFKLTEAEQGNITQLCRIMEGMPLGIELAAAWTAILSPREIVEEIRNNLDFLSCSKRDMEMKHQSLRATFDGSWQLLDEVQRDVFCRLSIFQGGFEREAALYVANASLNQVLSMVDRSMLNRDKNGRFFIHGLLRQYGIEKLLESLSDWEETSQQYCVYYTDFLLQREPDLLGNQMYIAWDEIRQEMDDIRAAINWAIIHWEPERVRKILAGLLAFYAVHGWHEGQKAFENIAQVKKEAIASQGMLDWARDPIYISARTHQAFLLCNLGQIEESEVISRECLEPLSSLGLNSELSECIHNLGVNASFRGEYEQGMEQLEQAILLGRDCQNNMWPTYLLWLGHAYFLLGEYDRGLESLQKCYEIFERQGNYWGMAFATSKMGLAADGLGEFAKAKEYHRRALDIFEKIDNHAGKGYALSRMSESAYFLEEYQQAEQLAEEGYAIFTSLGHLWGICTSLCRQGFGYIGLAEIGKAGACFKEALIQSRKYQTAPLSLYALAGMAATMKQITGQEKSAVKLFQFIQSHPKTPALCVQQAARWFSHQEQKIPWPDGSELDKIDIVMDRVLKQVNDLF